MEITPAEFERLFILGAPTLDVRSEIEFGKGALPESSNIPLLTTSERVQVGTCYKQFGREAALKLGHEIVSGEVKAQRVEKWRGFATSHAQPTLFCARGGLRSKISQQWLREAGVDIPRVQGGYKAIRGMLLSRLRERSTAQGLVLLSGRTGSGKTKLLETLPEQSIDLEKLARHRGSAFGAVFGAQPSQQTFENLLVRELLRRDISRPVVVESESRAIGRISLPGPLYERMQQAPVIVLATPLEERVREIKRMYVDELKVLFGSEDAVLDFLHQSLHRIERQLGSERTAEIGNLIRRAFEVNSEEAHAEWITPLLRWYYDPFYQRHLERNRPRIIFEGSAEEVRDYLARSDRFLPSR